jgi:hypothetical protein
MLCPSALGCFKIKFRNISWFSFYLSYLIHMIHVAEFGWLAWFALCFFYPYFIDHINFYFILDLFEIRLYFLFVFY